MPWFLPQPALMILVFQIGLVIGDSGLRGTSSAVLLNLERAVWMVSVQTNDLESGGQHRSKWVYFLGKDEVMKRLEQAQRLIA